MPLPLGVRTILPLSDELLIVVPVKFKLPIAVLLGKLVTPNNPT